LILAEVNNFALSVSAIFSQNTSVLNYSGKIYPGGLSTHAIGLFEANGTNLFDYRLRDYRRNFLFSTRTNGREIFIKRSEIAPFIFIHPGSNVALHIGDESIQMPTKSAGTVCSLNLSPVLNQYPDTERVDVYAGDYMAFRFVIEKEKPYQEKYLLRFKNSLGCFEVLEVTGRAENNPEFREESVHNELTSSFFYEERRFRTETQDVVTVQTGYKKRDEIPFLLDMVKSDEIYFITPEGHSHRCNVSCEMKYRERITEPVSFELKVKNSASDEYVTPSIDLYTLNYDRIFDEPFNEEFD
jgi:hypothetical protein